MSFFPARLLLWLTIKPEQVTNMISLILESYNVDLDTREITKGEVWDVYPTYLQRDAVLRKCEFRSRIFVVTIQKLVRGFIRIQNRLLSTSDPVFYRGSIINDAAKFLILGLAKGLAVWICRTAQ